MEIVSFVVLALVTFASAMGVILIKRAFYCALSLLLCLLGAGAIFIVLEAPLLGLIQMIIYGGAVVVLIIFVIMLIGAETEGRFSPSGWTHHLVVGALSTVLLVECTYGALALSTKFPSREMPRKIHSLGEVLFTRYLLPFELLSVLLLVAIVGAIVLSQKERQ